MVVVRAINKVSPAILAEGLHRYGPGRPAGSGQAFAPPAGAKLQVITVFLREEAAGIGSIPACL